MTSSTGCDASAVRAAACGGESCANTGAATRAATAAAPRAARKVLDGIIRRTRRLTHTFDVDLAVQLRSGEAIAELRLPHLHDQTRTQRVRHRMWLPPNLTVVECDHVRVRNRLTQLGHCR